MDITDNEDSISAKMFVTKTEDDEPFNKLFSKLKKGVKGAVYISLRAVRHSSTNTQVKRL